MDDSSVLVDTNVLLSATTPARPHHQHALRVLNDWPNDGVRLCTSGQILREYLVVCTRPIDQNGLSLSLAQAVENTEVLAARMRLLDESRAVFDRFRKLVDEVDISGKQLHDANVVATALAHGVSRLCTENTDDFERFAAFVDVLDLDDA